MTRDELRQMALDFCSQYTIGEITTEVTALLVLAAKSGLDEPEEPTPRSLAKGPWCGVPLPASGKTWCYKDVTDVRYRTTIIPCVVECPECLEAMEAAGVQRDAENMVPPTFICAVNYTMKEGIAEIGNVAASWCGKMIVIDSPARDTSTRYAGDVTCAACVIALAAFTGELHEGTTIVKES